VAEGLVRDLIVYLDTHVLFWLCENRLDRISGAALDALNQCDLLVSPMVMIELALLHEIGRSKRVPQDILRQLREQIGLRICDHSFPDIAETATFESWTRDPFDRMIVAHAKANGYAPLVTADKDIRKNYPKAVW
jgi:PIN domain nuclease of toxin-antitoxin system